MPLTLPLQMGDGGLVSEVLTGGTTAPQSERFTVKTGMNYWINVDYSHPTLARKLLLDGETIDTDDQDTIDILMAAPEIEYVGNTPE